MNYKVRTARLSIVSNCSLIILKVIAGFISGSVSIISEAIHSGMDLLASIIAYLSVKMSDTPPDKEHPYGHGKFENASGVIEGVLILAAAAWIIYEGIHKIIKPVVIENIKIGAIVMAVSAIINFFVSRRLYSVAKKTDSIALEADALHLRTDVYTSSGVAVGLMLIWLTGWQFLDPMIAISVAVLIIRESFSLLRRAYSPLLDMSLTNEETRIISETITTKGFSFHNLRTRKSGQYRFADVHLEMPENMALKEIHGICDQIEEEIKSKIKHFEIQIHVEPIR